MIVAALAGIGAALAVGFAGVTLLSLVATGGPMLAVGVAAGSAAIGGAVGARLAVERGAGLSRAVTAGAGGIVVLQVVALLGTDGGALRSLTATAALVGAAVLGAAIAARLAGTEIAPPDGGAGPPAGPADDR